MNSYKLEQCNICLENCHSTVITLQDADENNIKWFTKLQFTVPELEWLAEYLICDTCIKRLEDAWEFKKLVVKLETERRLHLTRKGIHQDSILDSRDNSDTTDDLNEENEIVCGICFNTFPTENQLRQHKLKNHTTDNKLEEFCAEDIDIESHKLEDIYTCYHCNVRFNTKDDLLVHIESDHSKSETCPLCEKSYSNKATLNDHLKHDHGIKSEGDYDGKEELDVHLNNDKTHDSLYHCDTCKNVYISEKNLKMHKLWCLKRLSECKKFISPEEYMAQKSLKKYLPNEFSTDPQLIVKNPRGRKPLTIFRCEVCVRPFEYVKLLVEHCMIEHEMEKKCIKPYSCEKCSMRFASSANLNQHQNYHKKDRKNMCSYCGKSFITKNDLTVHEYTHFNRRNYKCTKCDKAFNTNKNLRTHNYVVHTDRSLWKYGCAICEKRFPLKANFEQHIQRHTGEKKHECHICRKPFVSKTEVNRHVLQHTNIRAFKCDICGKEYKAKRTYKTHMSKVHSVGNCKITVREKKFVCDICSRRFYDKYKLLKHLGSHSGVKPFPCSACDKKFADKSYVKQHLKTVHNIEPEPH